MRDGDCNCLARLVDVYSFESLPDACRVLIGNCEGFRAIVLKILSVEFERDRDWRREFLPARFQPIRASHAAVSEVGNGLNTKVDYPSYGVWWDVHDYPAVSTCYRAARWPNALCCGRAAWYANRSGAGHGYRAAGSAEQNDRDDRNGNDDRDRCQNQNAGYD